MAIKKVFQDRRYRNRELAILAHLQGHCNVITLINSFHTCGT